MSGFSYRKLGKTGLEVSPLGIGGGIGISSEDLEYAFERGINYFFFSSDLHHFTYSKSVPALRTLCSKGSAVRDKVVLSTVSYLNDPDKLFGVIMDQFEELGVDYIDVFHWGWITRKTDTLPLFLSASDLKDNGAITHNYRKLQEMAQRATEINEEVLKRGLVRHIGASFHSLKVAQQWMGTLDVLMVKYNLAQLQPETHLFPYLSGHKNSDPGIVAFNVAHHSTNFFHIPPVGYPRGAYVPTIPDCYRFALSNPAVDLVLTGMQSRQEIDQAILAMEKGAMSQEENGLIREYAQLFAQNMNVAFSQ